MYAEPSLDKSASPPSLESFLVDLSLYEEAKMEELAMRAFSALENLFGGEAI